MADNPNEQRPEDDEQRLQGTDNDYDDPNMVVRAEQIVQSVGRPLEGLEAVRVPLDDPVLDEMRQRFRRRRLLANLSRFPNGYAFTWKVNDRQHHVILLNPPHQIAVQREDGTWFRRARNEAEDGPAPYTLNWWYAYLRASDLPVWFMSPEHIALLSDSTEAKALELDGTLSDLPEPPAGYLERRYTTPPQYLTPDLLENGEVYAATLDDCLISRMARRYPCILANARLFHDYRVYVLPSGHILIRYRRGDYADGSEVDFHVRQAALEWLPEIEQYHLAVYRIEGRRVGARNINAERERVQAAPIYGRPDPPEQPNGLGEFRWLNADIDPDLARTHGYNTPNEVFEARELGLLDNVPYNARPYAVWYPDPRFVNPREQPDGPGQWAYFTPETEQYATTNFGGQTWFPDTPRPTAAQMMDLRRRFEDLIARNLATTNPTDDIELVWVPDTPPPPPAPTGEPLNNADAPVTNTNAATTSATDLGVDPISNLPHDPTNGGTNDQTGREGDRKWQTVRINGKTFTVDRSVAHVGDRQDHKLWSVNRAGQWKKYLHADEMDWSSAKHVENLNRSREQTSRRDNAFHPKRENRKGYSDEENEWMFEHVKKVAGNTRKLNKKVLQHQFNEYFDQERNVGGISALIHRLCEYYKKHGAPWKPPKNRGRPKKDDSADGGHFDQNKDSDQENDDGEPDGEPDGEEDEDGVE